MTAHFLSPEIKELLTRSLTPVEMSSRNEVHVKERRGCSQKVCTVVKEVLHTERKSFWKERKKEMALEGRERLLNAGGKENEICHWGLPWGPRQETGWGEARKKLDRRAEKELYCLKLLMGGA